MDCYICGEKYKSWEGLFYHKRKIYNCEDVHSSRYELKHAVKLLEAIACRCMFCSRHLRKVKMAEHYLKEHRGNFTWVKCRLWCRKHREEEFRNHIKKHNIGEYYMKPEIFEDLLNTEHYDVILVTLKELAEKRRETNREVVSRQFNPLFGRCPFSGDIIGCRN